MSRNYKFHNPKGIYFVSFSVVYWLDIFSRPIYKDIIIDCLDYCIKEKGMELFAYCIMTNHIHLVFRSLEINPDKLLGQFKSFTSRKLIKSISNNSKESRRELFLDKFKQAAFKSSNVKNYQLWRHDNKPIELWSKKVLQQKINYVHYNPVKEGIVGNPEDYLYSSAKDYAGEKGYLAGVEVLYWVRNKSHVGWDGVE